MNISSANNGFIQEKNAGISESPGNTIIQIKTIIVIAICTLGLAANSCAFIVVVKSNIIKISTGVYLAFLAVFDNLSLFMYLLRTFSDLHTLSSLACKVINAAHLSMLTISCNILVTMTIERCHIIINPYKPNPTRKQATTIATVSAIIILLACSIQVGTITGLYTPPVGRTLSNMSSFNNADNATHDHILPITGTVKVCAILPQYMGYYRKVFNPIYMGLTKLVSPLLVLLCNAIIILYMRKKNTVVPLNAVSGVNQDKRITKMLIIVSLSFTMFVLPQGMYLLLAAFFYEHISEAVGQDNPAWQTILCWYLLNHSLNFFQYILSGKKFREESKNAFKSIINMFKRN